MLQTWMHALRQLHELMSCAEAAEHQLALISDAAEITDTYSSPSTWRAARRPSRNKKSAFVNALLKTEAQTAQKQV